MCFLHVLSLISLDLLFDMEPSSLIFCVFDRVFKFVQILICTVLINNCYGAQVLFARPSSIHAQTVFLMYSNEISVSYYEYHFAVCTLNSMLVL